MKKLSAIFFFSFFALSALCQSGREAEVWARVDAINKAVFEAKDSAALEDLVADKATYGHSTGEIDDKRAMIHRSVSNTDVYKNITVEKSGVINAGEAVVVRYILRADVLKEGNTTPLNIGILQVWAKDKGKWKLFARQAIKVNPKS